MDIRNNQSRRKYILVNGYTSTGSSAVIDLLRECEGTYISETEFRIIKEPFGIIDLDRQLTDSLDMLNDDITMRCFLWMIWKYNKEVRGFRSFGLAYKRIYGIDFYKLAKEYINKLTDYKYSSYWWFLSLNKGVLYATMAKGLKKLGIYDYRKHESMRLCNKTEKEFVDITREFLSGIFDRLAGGSKYVVLDQPIHPTHPEYAKRYFPNSSMIIVERDPRDVYIDLITEEKKNGDIVGHPGYEIASSHNVLLFIAWYKKYRNTKSKNKDYLFVRFEDIMLNYEKTVKEIFAYCEINPNIHIEKNKYLIPEKSKKNIGMWRKYKYRDEIRQIEKELPEYLYEDSNRR